MSKAFEHIDELYRQRFKDFEAEPPNEVWGKVKDHLHPRGGGPSSNFGRTFLLSIFSMMSIIAIVFFVLNPFKNPKPSLASGDYIAYNGQDQQDKLNNTNPVSSNEIATPLVDKAEAPAQKGNKESVPAKEPLDVKNTEEKQVHSKEQLNSLEQKNNMEWQFVNPKFNYLNSRRSSRFGANDNYYDPKASKGYWQFGASLNPEIVLYPDDSINNSRNYNLDLSLSYHKSNFFVETGLGISFARDEGRYLVDYESYEYMGSYNDLIGITYDSTETGVIPVYHSEEVDIYDSIRRLKIEKSVNTYTYLQIPLLIGYEKKFKRFGYYFKAGPNVSILINKQIPGTQLSGDIKVFDVDARIAERIKTNWQILLGAGLTYQMSKNMDLALEPTFRYYLNSAYDRKYVSTKHPFAFGIRAGIKIRIK